ncbi:uncharacterized protein A1O5_04955 [Cladophialophora psammophila CBS 110553]|uniref:DNA (cytosine-5-)-methyltransferase n=1 Tax=Cladophialophora psammophila CBS 110553 TaxID=1182543 RepID=W9X6B4_9EURO|nr:uncharacterized protein A1O5_04955 [Cladophialophora psammophila CBS 110553]EXJ72451.1 hypothetical protein A1O5_04955 [Cladophialophora psammophila CBS 110553]
MLPYNGMEALQAPIGLLKAQARPPGTNSPPGRFHPYYRDHLPELYDKDVIVLGDDDDNNNNDNDEELVITGSRQVPKPWNQKPRRDVHINQAWQLFDGPVGFHRGCDVELADHSFMRIDEYLPFVEGGPLIKGYRLLHQNHWELLMPERPFELVQLVKIDENLSVQSTMSTAKVSQVIRKCTIIFTSQRYGDLNYRDHVRRHLGSDNNVPFNDVPFYFCRYKSADCNVRIDGRVPTGPPLTGRIEHLHSSQADNGVLIAPDGRQIEFQISNGEVRRQWRGKGHSKSRRYTFGDAFCGAGGTSSGALEAGLKFKFGVDFDLTAIATYRNNFECTGTQVMLNDISDFIKIACASEDGFKVDFLHMSPPCQPFCGANRSPNEEANRENMNAFSKVGDLLDVCKPRVATLEEAKSLTDIDKRKYFRDLISWFIEKGYSVQWKAVELAKFGVPQTRNRTIIIASGPGEQLPAFVRPTHGDGPGLKPIPSINSAINSIPANASHQKERPFMRAPKPPYAGTELCKTIMTSVKSHHYHPSGLRRFNIREYASLQTFPPTFVFAGSMSEKLKQIGNAVPPLFAQTLFKHLKEKLTAADDAEEEEYL